MVYYNLEMKPYEEKQLHVKSFICIYKHVCVCRYINAYILQTSCVLMLIF